MSWPTQWTTSGLQKARQGWKCFLKWKSHQTSRIATHLDAQLMFWTAHYRLKRRSTSGCHEQGLEYTLVSHQTMQEMWLSSSIHSLEMSPHNTMSNLMISLRQPATLTIGIKIFLIGKSRQASRESKEAGLYLHNRWRNEHRKRGSHG